jgi:heme/copper-type cytochrome/quinol oxidase subunit 1
MTALFLGGFGNLLVPLMCGSRDMAFPYVNMLSYWMFVLAVIVLLASFFAPGGPQELDGLCILPKRLQLAHQEILGV